MCYNASVNLEIDDQEDTVQSWLSQTKSANALTFCEKDLLSQSKEDSRCLHYSEPLFTELPLTKLKVNILIALFY